MIKVISLTQIVNEVPELEEMLLKQMTTTQMEAVLNRIMIYAENNQLQFIQMLTPDQSGDGMTWFIFRNNYDVML